MFKDESVIGEETDSGWIEFMSLSQFNVGSAVTLSGCLQICNDNTRKLPKCCQSPIAFILILCHIARFLHTIQKYVFNNLDIEAQNWKPDNLWLLLVSEREGVAIVFFHFGKCLLGTAALCSRWGTSVLISLSKTAAFYSILNWVNSIIE